MMRASLLLVALALCIWQAPGPDPRWLAAVNSSLASFLPNLRPNAVATVNPDDEFRCPMDPDVHSVSPMKCPRCGMTLIKGIVEAVEYPMNLTTEPQRIRPGDDVLLNFGIVNPKTGKPVREFEVVHEKLYHLFVVSQDLKFFLHTHPEREPNTDFHLQMRFPKPGMYRLLSDFYPASGTPQLIVNTVLVPGAGTTGEAAKLDPDLGPQHSENSEVALELAGSEPVAGTNTSLNFRVRPNNGIEPYLGVMAHMLAASSDLVDMIHQHPVQSADALWSQSKQLTFNMTFPRPGVYRLWIQFQRNGVVNTAAFNVPVTAYR